MNWKGLFGIPEIPVAEQFESLSFAIMHGELEKVKSIVHNNSDLLFMKDDVNGWTPLHQAAVAQGKAGSDPAAHRAVAEFLLNKGADVNARDNGDATPLYWATTVVTGTAAILLAHGADVNAKDNEGTTPLHHVLSPNDAESLVNRGADVNAKDNRGNAPLHTSAMSANKQLVIVLLASGASVNAKNSQGETPLRLLLDMVKANTNRSFGTPIWSHQIMNDEKRTIVDQIIKLLRQHGGSE